MANSFWDESGQTVAIAHRGGDAAGRPKRNTQAAFAEAVKLGYEYLETDVVNTKDGEVVVAHGAITPVSARLRGTFTHRTLQGMTYPQIERHLRVAGEKIPLLEDLLRKYPNARFFIDPKTDTTVLPLANLIKRLAVQDRVCVGSFSYSRVRTFIKLTEGSKVHTSVIIGRGMIIRNHKLSMLKTGRLRDIEAVQLHHSLVSREMINLAHKQGLKAVIWTCNSPLSIKNAVNCGADGIISDDSRLLMKIVGSN